MTQEADKPKRVIPLHAEEVSIDREKVPTATVRIKVQTNSREQLVDEELRHTRVEIKRIPIGRTVDKPPPVRTEGDTIIIPVMEEIIVVERRLRLKEEIIVQRVGTTGRHQESVLVYEQEAVIERQPAEVSQPSATSNHQPKVAHDQGASQMLNETIVAVFDSEAEAAAAVAELEAAGIPANDIERHAKGGVISGSVAHPAPRREPGFWAKLFGAEPERNRDTAVYDRSLEAGGTVVTVRSGERYDQVLEILERHHPIDIDERGAGYLDVLAITEPSKTMDASGMTRRPAQAGAPSQNIRAQDAKEQKLPLAEETVAIGQRAINRGTTRVRRYVVETPVEEQVNLRRESVAVERRPVSDDRPINNADFTDKVVEVTETDEEPVVSKQARIKEEVVIHKQADERTETVRDTARREEAEVTRDADEANRPSVNPAVAKG
jgi:uncharacterized protein (TIGR02271 family)